MHIENLLPNEKIIESFGVSKRILFLRTLIGLMVGCLGLIANYFLQKAGGYEMFDIFADLISWIVIFVPMAVGIFLVARSIWFYFSYKYYLTNRRIIETTGVIAKRTISANLSAVTDIVVNQDVVERFILKTGSILVNTAGSPEAEVVLIGVENPYIYKQKIQDLALKRGMKSKIQDSLAGPNNTNNKHASWTNFPQE